MSDARLWVGKGVVPAEDRSRGSRQRSIAKFGAGVLFCICMLASMAAAQGELRFCLRSEPKTFDPLKVEDDASVAIRYLTGGVLVRMNRQTQALEPELAAIMEGFERRKTDHVQVAQRRFVFGRHAVLREGRGLYDAAVDGPRAAFADR